MSKIRNQLAGVAAGILTIVGHHYGSMLLDYRANMQANKDQALRDQDMELVKSKLSDLWKETKSISEKLSQAESAKNIDPNKIGKASELLDSSSNNCALRATTDILAKGMEQGQVTTEIYSKAFKAAQRCSEVHSNALETLKSLLEDIKKIIFYLV